MKGKTNRKMEKIAKTKDLVHEISKYVWISSNMK